MNTILANSHEFRLPDHFTEFRPEQIDLAFRIKDAYDRGVEVVLVQAPAGVGKSLLAEMVRQLMGTRMLYLPPHIQLQEQMEKNFGGDPTYAKILMGRSNYPSPVYNKRCGDCVESKLCRGKVCAYKEAKRVFNASTIGITNLAYFLAAANHTKMFKPCADPTPTNDEEGDVLGWTGDYLTVIDEADLLEDIILNYLNVNISQSYIDRLANTANLAAPIPPIYNQVNWFNWLGQVLDLVKAAIVEFKLQEMHKSEAGAKEFERMKYLRASLSDVEEDWLYDARRLRKVGGRRTGEAYQVILEPVRVGNLGNIKVWNHIRRGLLMSASFAHPRTFVEIESGLEQSGKSWEYMEVPSTWEAWRRPIFRMPIASISKKSEDGVRKGWKEQAWWPEYIAAMLGIILDHPEDRILIHTVSHQLSSDIGSDLRDCLGDRIITYAGMEGREGKDRINFFWVLEGNEETTRQNSLEKFKSTTGGVLVSASAARGIDLPYDSCRHIIVAKVPWGNLGDKRVSARKWGDGGWMWYMVKAVREILQSTARAMRAEDDWCKIWVLDSEFDKLIQNRGLFPAWYLRTVRPVNDLYIPPVHRHIFELCSP